MIRMMKERKEKQPLTKCFPLKSISRVQSRHQVESRTCTYATGKLNDVKRRWIVATNREEIGRSPRYISPLVFLVPRNRLVTDPGFNSLGTWDESIFPGAIIVGVEAKYGEHVKIQNYKNILVAPYQPIAAALVSNVPTFTYKQRRELACN